MKQSIDQKNTADFSKKYFQNQIDPMIGYESYKKLKHQIKRAESTVNQQILAGETEIAETSQQVGKDTQKSQDSKDLPLSEKPVEDIQVQLKRVKREILLQKRQQLQKAKLQNEQKKAQNQEKIKLWSEQQKVLNERRNFMIKQRQKQAAEEQQKLKKQKQVKQQQEKIQKLRMLKEKQLKSQKDRQDRKKFFERSISQTKSIKLPRFKEIQEKYSKVQKQEANEKETKIKNSKVSSFMDHESIRMHEKKCLQRDQQRLLKRGYSTEKPLTQKQIQLSESRYRTLLTRNDEEIQKQRQKLRRRAEFQKTIKQIPICIDQNKRIKSMILQDKAKNPFKYHILGQKSFTDYQIFTEFKDFKLSNNRNELGQHYMEQANGICRESRIKKSMSSKNFMPVLVQEKQQHRYKDYLQELKSHRSTHDLNKVSSDSDYVQDKISQTKSKRSSMQQLAEKSQIFDSNIKLKKSQLRKYKSISSKTIDKEKQLNQMYIKSIRAKLACIELE